MSLDPLEDLCPGRAFLGGCATEGVQGQCYKRGRWSRRRDVFLHFLYFSAISIEKHDTESEERTPQTKKKQQKDSKDNTRYLKDKKRYAKDIKDEKKIRKIPKQIQQYIMS